MVKSINKEEFDKIFTKNGDTINSSENCILKFTAEWCGPCKMMSPILEKISNEQNISVYEIDTDDEFELAQIFNIRSIPTIYFVPVNGESHKHIGAIAQGQIEKLINKYFKSGE